MPASVEVTTAVDENDGTTTSIDALIATPGGTGISLREAIIAANNTTGDDDITFAAALNGVEIDLMLGQMTISETLTITGNGATNTIVDAQAMSRIFDMDLTGDVTLDGLTLNNGHTTGSDGEGGAIRFLTTSGTLTIQNSTLSGNATDGEFADGGAIASTSGAVRVTNSTLSGNSTAGSSSDGGAIYSLSGAVTVTNSTLSGNSTALRIPPAVVSSVPWPR